MPRRRDLAETPSWAPTGTFTFDGSTSDFALQLYNRYADSGSIGKLGLSVVPDVVVSRLEDVGVTFDDLDGFAQRAVLWDSGFAVTADNEAKRIWTIGGRSMAELALTLDEYEATGCTTFQCTQPDGAETYNNNLCNETAMFTGVKCIAEEFEQHNLNLAMWSIGGESTMGLEIELVNHNWDDHGIENKVYAVHTVSSAVERQYANICSATRSSYGYLNFPCYGAGDVPDDVEKTEPAPSEWVTRWMKEYSSSSSSPPSSSSSSSSASKYGLGSSKGDSSGDTQSDTGRSGSSVTVLGGAVGGSLALLLIGVLLGLCIARRRRQRDLSSEDAETPKPGDHVEMMTPQWSDGQRPTTSTQARSTLDEFRHTSTITTRSSADSMSIPGADRTIPPPPPSPRHHCRANHRPAGYQSDFRHNNIGHSVPGPIISSMSNKQSNQAVVGSGVIPPPPYEEALHSSQKSKSAAAESPAVRDPNSVLQALATDPSVYRRRVALDEMRVEKQLPMTSLQTDSCVAWYCGKQVQVKRLTPSQEVDVAALEGLADEIQRRARVEHSNIVQFIGAGWSSSLDLTMVIEFMPLGTLRNYLNNTKESGWNPQKTKIAIGVARALAYLHSQTPIYIYYQLCAKNVLLTNELEAKLADCGSPETALTSEAKKTSHQAFWFAPEVLNGAPHSAAADIYSFGVLLTELDTCKGPYFDALLPSGSNLEQTEILALVQEGRLRPSFSAECPQFIRQLGVTCCQQDPEKRLTAAQIAQLLEMSSSNN